MEQRLICIVAGQRAGTTALQQAMVLTGNVKNFGEIFQIKEGNSGATRQSFHEFARVNQINFAETMRADGAGMVARRYVEWLRHGAGRKHVLIDIKLNSWLALTPAWNYPHDEPFFLKFLKSQGTAFIFVWRRSLVDQILSLFISNELRLWHNLTEENVGNRKLEAPVERLERLALLMCRAESQMREHLQTYREKIEIAYEDLFQDGDLSDAFRASLNELTGISIPDRELRIQPNRIDKRAIVINYEDAANAIAAIERRHRSQGRALKLRRAF